MGKEATDQAEVMCQRAMPTGYSCRVLLRDSMQDKSKSFSHQAIVQPAGDPCMRLRAGQDDVPGPQALQIHCCPFFCSEALPDFPLEFSKLSRE